MLGHLSVKNVPVDLPVKLKSGRLMNVLRRFSLSDSVEKILDFPMMPQPPKFIMITKAASNGAKPLLLPE